MAAEIEVCFETLEAELARLEAVSAVHRADFERERDRYEHPMAGNRENLRAEFAERFIASQTHRSATPLRLPVSRRAFFALPGWTNDALLCPVLKRHLGRRQHA